MEDKCNGKELIPLLNAVVTLPHLLPLDLISLPFGLLCTVSPDVCVPHDSIPSLYSWSGLHPLPPPYSFLPGVASFLQSFIIPFIPLLSLSLLYFLSGFLWMLSFNLLLRLTCVLLQVRDRTRTTQEKRGRTLSFALLSSQSYLPVVPRYSN